APRVGLRRLHEALGGAAAADRAGSSRIYYFREREGAARKQSLPAFRWALHRQDSQSHLGRIPGGERENIAGRLRLRFRRVLGLGQLVSVSARSGSRRIIASSRSSVRRRGVGFRLRYHVMMSTSSPCCSDSPRIFLCCSDSLLRYNKGHLSSTHTAGILLGIAKRTRHCDARAFGAPRPIPSRSGHRLPAGTAPELAS
ncbi:unnamed protein product, partial [Ectocarpus sp. 12 AP-2014]